MNPIIALTIYFVLLLILLSVDLKNNNGVSNAVWLPLLWIIVIGTKPLVLWIYPNLTDSQYGTDVGGLETGSAIDQILFISILFFGILILIKRRLIKIDKWIIILFVYSMVSLLWSDFPFIGFKRLFRGIGSVVMILVILTEKDPIAAMKTVIFRCAYITVPLSIVLIKYYRQIGAKYDFYSGLPLNVGITSDKNTLGRLCLICGIFLFWDIFNKWKSRNTASASNKRIFTATILIFTMVCYLLYKANSATASICLMAGIANFLFMGVPILRNNVRYYGFLLIFSALTLFFMQYFFNVLEFFVTSSGRDMTFTGRTDLWNTLLNFNINPLIGTGYGSFWLGERLRKLWEMYWWTPMEAHNGCLEIYLNLGLIGVFIWIALLGSFFSKIQRNARINFDLGRFQMSVLLIFILYNITEGSTNLQLLSVFILFLVCLCPVRENHSISKLVSIS